MSENCAATIDRTHDSIAVAKRVGVEYVILDGVSIDGTQSAIRSQGGLVRNVSTYALLPKGMIDAQLKDRFDGHNSYHLQSALG